MKYVFIFFIHLYQITVSPFLHSILGVIICRHSESCPDYAIRLLKEKGVIKGSPFVFGRLLSCQPFARI